jgi:hypothetical protein
VPKNEEAGASGYYPRASLAHQAVSRDLTNFARPAGRSDKIV